MIATDQLVIRHYQPGDIMHHLAPEYMHMELTPELCWVAEGSSGEIVGVVLVSAGHQTAVLLRVASLPGTPGAWLLAMLRHVFKELVERDYKLVIACMSAARVEELKMARIFERAGGKLTPISGFVGAVLTRQAGRW